MDDNIRKTLITCLSEVAFYAENLETDLREYEDDPYPLEHFNDIFAEIRKNFQEAEDTLPQA